MTTQRATLDPVGLHYAFLPSTEWQLAPGQIVVTTDPQATVQNTLRFSIRNPLGHPVVNFENPDHLDLESDLPPITAGQQWPKPLDRLYLRFPWCDDPPPQCSGNLTSTGYAQHIICSPDEGTNLKWYTLQMSDPTVGLYWILFPKDKSVSIQAGESIQFLIEGIITPFKANTTTEIYIKPNVAGYESKDEAVATIYLTDPSPQIKMWASADNVLAGTTARLFWRTLNAKTCRLSPIDGAGKETPPQEPEGFPVRVLLSTTFTLKATSPLGQTETAVQTINVRPVAVQSFRAEPASGVRLGDDVKLLWTTESAVTCEITPDIGYVCADALGCEGGQRGVRPAVYTEYTLTASGQGLPQKHSVAVFPLPPGWSIRSENAPWEARARPVTLLFSANAALLAMWFFAAGTGTADNPVFWSRDGAKWFTAINNAPFSQRGNSGGAVFKSKMWLLGGQDDSGKLNDVWSSGDGSVWEQVKPSGPIWSSRAAFGCAVFKERLWVLGGTGADGKLLKDLWSTSDGVTWKKEGDAQWPPRAEFGVALFQERLWILGGKVDEAPGVSNAVWSSADGVNWSQENDGTWERRSNPATQVIQNRLYLCGGMSASNAGLSDLWFLRDGTWANLAAPPWKDNRRNLSSLQYQDALWLLGRQLDTGDPNQQVWVYAVAGFVQIRKFDLVCVDSSERCASPFYQAKIRWQTAGAYSVTITDLLSNKQYPNLPGSGEMDYRVNGRYYFQITCIGENGTATQNLKNPSYLGKLRLSAGGRYLGVKPDGKLAMLNVDKGSPDIMFAAHDQGNGNFALLARNGKWVLFTAIQSPIAWYDVLDGAATSSYPVQLSFQYFDPAGAGVKFAFISENSKQVAVYIVNGINRYCSCEFDVAMGWGGGQYFGAS